MKIAAGVLTHNMASTGRRELFNGTVRSLLQGSPEYLFIIDNASTDGSAEYVASLGGTCLSDPIWTCGHGMNRTIAACVATDAELVVFSNDDIAWRPGWRDSVEAFWAEAPDDLLICSGLLEDDFPWNTPREALDVGGVHVLVRRTAPGGTWTLRSRDWQLIGPVPEAPGYDDVPTCERLNAAGYRVAQMDVADHLGEAVSTWGNGSARFRRPLDRGAWGFERQLDPT